MPLKAKAKDNKGILKQRTTKFPLAYPYRARQRQVHLKIAKAERAKAPLC